MKTSAQLSYTRGWGPSFEFHVTLFAGFLRIRFGFLSYEYLVLLSVFSIPRVTPIK